MRTFPLKLDNVIAIWPFVTNVEFTLTFKWSACIVERDCNAVCIKADDALYKRDCVFAPLYDNINEPRVGIAAVITVVLLYVWMVCILGVSVVAPGLITISCPAK